MTRPIELRLWAKGFKEMLYGVESKWILTEIPKLFVKPILMQYTGLKDVNGNKIFEGDVIKLLPIKLTEKCITDYKECIGVVTWKDDEITGYRVPYSRMFEGKKLTYNPYLCGWHVYEVLGNIYEHPGLLK